MRKKARKAAGENASPLNRTLYNYAKITRDLFIVPVIVIAGYGQKICSEKNRANFKKLRRNGMKLLLVSPY